MSNAIQAAIELLESAHVSTDLVWKRHDCVEALKKLAKPSELDNELDRVVEWAEDLCGVGHSAWDTIDPRLIASAILEAADNLSTKFEPSCFADFQENHKEDRGCDSCQWLERCTLNKIPQRTWVGLSDEERQEIALEVPIDAVLITEAKLKDKNSQSLHKLYKRR